MPEPPSVSILSNRNEATSQRRKRSRGFVWKIRDHPGVSCYSGNVIVAGGAIGRERLKAVEVYNASTGEWSRMTDLTGLA